MLEHNLLLDLFSLFQVCTGNSSNQMICLTPQIKLGDIGIGVGRKKREVTMKSASESHLRVRRKRQASDNMTINKQENIDIDIDFILDGVPDYRNLTAVLPEYDELNAYADPTFTRFPPPTFTMTFTPTWPVEDKILEIRVCGNK